MTIQEAKKTLKKVEQAINILRPISFAGKMNEAEGHIYYRLIVCSQHLYEWSK